MSARNYGGPAFPRELPTGEWSPDECMRIIEQHSGMTLRDYFAAKAIAGFIAGHIHHYGHDQYWPHPDMAAEAYSVADAMLKARAS